MEHWTLIKTKFPLLARRPHYEPLNLLCSSMWIQPWYNFQSRLVWEGEQTHRRKESKKSLGSSYSLIWFAFSFFEHSQLGHRCADTPEEPCADVKEMFYVVSALPPAFAHLVCSHHRHNFLWRHHWWFSIQYWIKSIHMFMYSSIHVCTVFYI